MMMMKTNLSPATQAVRRDLSQIMHEMSQRCRVSISATDTLPITLETNDASLQAGINSLCAAALLAAADQVVPKEKVNDYVTGAPQAYALQRRVTRREFLAIAAELEALDD
jgi:hypothetical protein